MTRRWTLAAVAALGLAFSTIPFGAACNRAPAGEKTAAAAPAAGKCDAKAKPANLDFVLKDMNGRDVKLADFKGKVILLNFWATWCGPCKYEIPMFVELQAKYQDQGLTFLGFSVDDPPDKLKPFAEQYKINYPVLVGLGHEDVQDAFGPMWGIPVTLMISRDGNVCKRHMGIATKDQLEQDIKDLL
jgi:thiol-disulfide isomerase/thioredoxin